MPPALMGVGIALVVVLLLAKAVVVVPKNGAFVIERLGEYDRTLIRGLHVVLPFIDRIAYRQSLKDAAVDLSEQMCITHDHIQVRVDGVLYIKVFDAEKASYGVADYELAIQLLTQTALRSEVNQIELVKLFESRNAIKARVREDIDKVAQTWGVRVLKFEIKNIWPPQDVLAAVNAAEGAKQLVIKQSEATRQKQINDAEGKAAAIRAISNATAEGIRTIGAAVHSPGGIEAMQLRVAEQYVARIGELAKGNNTVVLPSNPTDLTAMITQALHLRKEQAAPPHGDDKGEPS